MKTLCTKAAAVALIIFAAQAAKAEVLTGSCGDNLTYVLNTADSTLVIKGTGAMTDYGSREDNPNPWYSYRNNIASVVIESGITTIGNEAFYYCNALTSVSIPSSVTTIGSVAFAQCAMTGITIPNSVTTIGNEAFYSCDALTSVTIPASITTIGNRAFRYCSALTSASVPSSVTKFGDVVWDGCYRLTAINVDAANANYSSQDGVLFNKTKTTLLQCPQAKAGAYTIPSSTDTIGSEAFSGCNALTAISIGSGVSTISGYAFMNCRRSLTAIYNYATTPQTINSSVFEYDTLANMDLYVPAASVAAYRAANIWKDFRSIKAIPDNPNAVSSEALPNLAIYPNPAGDMLYTTDEFAGIVEIYDLSGTLVLTAASNAINISSLPSGIYVVKAGIRSTKVVKR